jgi:hypothetical protein
MSPVALALEIEVPFFTTRHINHVFLIMAAYAQRRTRPDSFGVL